MYTKLEIYAEANSITTWAMLPVAQHSPSNFPSIFGEVKRRNAQARPVFNLKASEIPGKYVPRGPVAVVNYLFGAVLPTNGCPGGWSSSAILKDGGPQPRDTDAGFRTFVSKQIFYNHSSPSRKGNLLSRPKTQELGRPLVGEHAHGYIGALPTPDLIKYSLDILSVDKESYPYQETRCISMTSARMW